MLHTLNLAHGIHWPSSLPARHRDRQRQDWMDNIKDKTGLDFHKTQVAARDGQRWRQIVRSSVGCPYMWNNQSDRLRISQCVSNETCTKCLVLEVSFIWRIFDVTLTVRCSSPSRIQKLCSKRTYTIRPTTDDGSTTDGTISSTTKKWSLSIVIHWFMIWAKLPTSGAT